MLRLCFIRHLNHQFVKYCRVERYGENMKLAMNLFNKWRAHEEELHHKNIPLGEEAVSLNREAKFTSINSSFTYLK